MVRGRGGGARWVGGREEGVGMDVWVWGRDVWVWGREVVGRWVGWGGGRRGFVQLS